MNNGYSMIDIILPLLELPPKVACLFYRIVANLKLTKKGKKIVML